MSKKIYAKARLLLGITLVTGLPLVDGCVEQIQDLLSGIGIG